MPAPAAATWHPTAQPALAGKSSCFATRLGWLGAAGCDGRVPYVRCACSNSIRKARCAASEARLRPVCAAVPCLTALYACRQQGARRCAAELYSVCNRQGTTLALRTQRATLLWPGVFAAAVPSSTENSTVHGLQWPASTTTQVVQQQNRIAQRQHWLPLDSNAPVRTPPSISAPAHPM